MRLSSTSLFEYLREIDRAETIRNSLVGLFELRDYAGPQKPN